mmetsp:Transcript_20608/g.51328  ORF Transcript_20608/g.51328 Transcript_20608/m.51328 type:complete len:205 (+) Transcript_20608:1792-2406(+)
MVELSADQSQRSTTPSCAFHFSVLLPGLSGLMNSSLPLPNSTWSPSGAQLTQYMGTSRCSRTERSMPLRLHTLSAPSSPTVTSAVPSEFHRSEMTAPRCASTDFSTRPLRPTILNVPSVQDTTNTSLPAALLLLAPGDHCMSVTNVSKSITFPPASPLMSQRHTVLSSLQLYSSLNTFHPTALTKSEWMALPCFWIFNFMICLK